MTELVDMRQVAELAGVKYETIVIYRHRGILPIPHFIAGNSPIWTRSSIDTWLENRPKRGRPPKLTR